MLCNNIRLPLRLALSDAHGNVLFGHLLRIVNSPYVFTMLLYNYNIMLFFKEPCPRGMYHHELRDQCFDCPIGQYSDVEGVTQCESCPEGFSTQQPGSTNSTDCRRKYRNIIHFNGSLLTQWPQFNYFALCLLF